MDAETRNSLREIVDYLYADEERDWTASDMPSGHIFEDITRVTEWLKLAAQK